MIRPADDILLDLTTEIEKALNAWATSLPSAEAESMAMVVSGIEYTPNQILAEVQRQTEFGKEFLSELCTLHFRMKETEPSASVIDLIRKSMGPGNQIPEMMNDQQKARYKHEISRDRLPDEMEGEIGEIAGAIWNVLNVKGPLTRTRLQEEVGDRELGFDWAIGWLAREEKIDIRVADRSIMVCLRQQKARPA